MASVGVALSTPSRTSLRQVWYLGTVVLTLGVTGYLLVAGSRGAASVESVIFVGSGVHVAATAWFFTLPEMRAHARANAGRFVVVPLALVAGTAALAMVIDPVDHVVFLTPYFVWQYFHYQKQNVGLVALTGVAYGSGSIRPVERHCILAAGVSGIVGLMAHPELLGLDLGAWEQRWLFGVALAAFSLAVAVGLVGMLGRKHLDLTFVVMYVPCLVFFAPVFLFDDPYRAALTFAIAHGYQYLLIVTLVSASPRHERHRAVSVVSLIAIALAGGWLLDGGAGMATDDTFGQAAFGGYLGLVMAHFVVDAGIWRLRDEFPRRFMAAHLPYLVDRKPPRHLARD